MDKLPINSLSIQVWTYAECSQLHLIIAAHSAAVITPSGVVRWPPNGRINDHQTITHSYPKHLFNEVRLPNHPNPQKVNHPHLQCSTQGTAPSPKDLFTGQTTKRWGPHKSSIPDMDSACYMYVSHSVMKLQTTNKILSADSVINSLSYILWVVSRRRDAAELLHPKTLQCDQ